MSRCPKCDSEDIRRSRTKTRWERWRKDITGKRPYRCMACRWRGWMLVRVGESHDRSQTQSTAPDPPNLRGTLLARPAPRQLDPKELDRFRSAPGKDET